MKKTKIQKLKAHLENGKTVTGLQAIRLWGYYRLSDGISKLRKRGLPIKTVMIKKGGEEYARYSL